jgi:phosphopantetheine--protein transferase-like protein
LQPPKLGFGIDIIEVRRFKQRKVKSNLRFYKSIYTESELKYSERRSNPYQHLAGIFAAKEATIKCLHMPLKMTEIEISKDSSGRPTATVIFKKKTIKVNISISHTAEYAVAAAFFFDSGQFKI